jgi:ubiquitin-conjugating enzyme E2 D/E
MSAIPRIKKELETIIKNPPNGITAGIINDRDIFKWTATIFGPEDTPYHGGIFKLKIIFPENYPFSPPNITFTTPIYHCNISKNGSICLDILKDQWSPALTIDKVLLSISSLLSDPNPTDPLVPEAAHLLRTDKQEYMKIAKKYTMEHAMK